MRLGIDFTCRKSKALSGESRFTNIDELCTLIKKTVGLVEPLRDALRSSHRKIHLAFVYGSVAKKTDHASTDIDLLVVSDEMILEDLYFLLSNVEAELNRKINPTLYTSAEFDDRLRTGNSFLSRVLKQPTIQLIGELPKGIEHLQNLERVKQLSHEPPSRTEFEGLVVLGQR